MQERAWRVGWARWRPGPAARIREHFIASVSGKPGDVLSIAGDADGESGAAACLVHALAAPAGPDLLPHLACAGTACAGSLARRLADGGCHAGVAAAAAGGLEALARLPANRPLILQVGQAAWASTPVVCGVRRAELTEQLPFA